MAVSTWTFSTAWGASVVQHSKKNTHAADENSKCRYAIQPAAAAEPPLCRQRSPVTLRQIRGHSACYRISIRISSGVHSSTSSRTDTTEQGKKPIIIVNPPPVRLTKNQTQILESLISLASKTLSAGFSGNGKKKEGFRLLWYLILFKQIAIKVLSKNIPSKVGKFFFSSKYCDVCVCGWIWQKPPFFVT